VWSQEQKGFTKVDSIPETKKMGGVEINLNSSKVTKVYGGQDDQNEGIIVLGENDIEVVGEIADGGEAGHGGEKKDVVNMKKVTMDEINTVFGDPAKLDDLLFVPDEDERSTRLLNHLSETATEVDVGLNAEALEAASKAAAVMPKYENEEELLDDLDVSHPTVFKNAPLHALANRIGKLLYQHAYYAGYMDRKDSELVCNPAATTYLIEKKTKAQSYVRKLKLMVRILSGAIHNSSGIHATKRKFIVDAVKSERAKGNTLTSENIDTLFSVGDVKEYSEIRQVKLAVLEQDQCLQGEGDD
jgi:hypothetical protein